MDSRLRRNDDIIEFCRADLVGFDHAAHHIPCSEKGPASAWNMIIRDPTAKATLHRADLDPRVSHGPIRQDRSAVMGLLAIKPFGRLCLTCKSG